MSVDSEVQDGHWETDFLLGQWWTTRIGCPERQSLEVLEDLPRQSHKPSQTHIRVYEHVNPKLPVTLQHLTHKITPVHVPAKHPQLCGLSLCHSDWQTAGRFVEWPDPLQPFPRGSPGLCQVQHSREKWPAAIRQQRAVQAADAQFFDSSKGVFPKPFKYKSTGFI